MTSSSSRSFRIHTLNRRNPAASAIRRIGFAKSKDNPARGTLLVQWRANGRTYYYANIRSSEYRRLRALARNNVLRTADLRDLLIQSSPLYRQVAPVIGPLR